MKFVFPPHAGRGRFPQAGDSRPGVYAPFVGVDWKSSAVPSSSWGTCSPAWPALPLLIDIAVAIASTKIPCCWAPHAPAPPVPPQVGFWAVLHESRGWTPKLLCSLSCSSWVRGRGRLTPCWHGAWEPRAQAAAGVDEASRAFRVAVRITFSIH